MVRKYEEKGPIIFYPFGFNGKKYRGQKEEKIKCPKCNVEFNAEVIESDDPDYVGYCHVIRPSKCPKCNQKFWYRDGFEKK